MPEYILEAENIRFKYDIGVDVLKDISLKIKKGSKTVFIGENGSGKSTLFLHFNGILKPQKGNILYKNKKIKYSGADINLLRKNIGIVFQDPETQLFASNVLQEISFGPLNTGLSQEETIDRVDSAMKVMNIESLKDEPTHFLSYGQKKSVTIASIIAMNPEVIIFDEPTNYLDPKHKNELIEFLDKLVLKGVTVVLSTHDVDLAYSWADYVFVMKDGEVIKEGLPQDIFNNIDLLSSTNFTKPLLLELYEKLIQAGIIKHGDKLPKTKEELFDLIY